MAPTPTEPQAFAARTDALPQLRAFVQRRGQELAIPAEVVMRLLVIAEELFINSVVHGYGGNSDHRIGVDLLDAGHEVELSVEDSAPPFDPFAGALSAGDPRERPIGGQGLPLIARMSSRRSYARHGGRNYVTVAVLKAVQGSANLQKKLPTGR